MCTRFISFTLFTYCAFLYLPFCFYLCVLSVANTRKRRKRTHKTSLKRVCPTCHVIGNFRDKSEKQGEQKVTHMTCVDILAVRADFQAHVKFHTAVQQRNVYFIAKFCWSIPESDKIVISTKVTSHFSALTALFSPVVCWWLQIEPVCWWWDEDADLEMDKVTADARSDHHWHWPMTTQAVERLVKFAVFTDGLQGDFQLTHQSS